MREKKPCKLKKKNYRDNLSEEEKLKRKEYMKNYRIKMKNEKNK